MNRRIVTCENCGGDGGFESMPYGYSHIDGSPLTHWNQCSACGGSGEYWVDVQPTGMDEPDEELPPREEWPSTMDYAETPFAENH